MTKKHCVFQTGSIVSLLSAVYEGDCTIGELKQYGDLGLGTPDLVHGEIVIDQGRFVCIDENGVARELSNDEKTPFSVVIPFVPTNTFVLKDISSFAEFESALDAQLDTLNQIYAVRLHGKFDKIKARSECAQPKPFKPLGETLPQLQNVFNWENLTGPMVGFRFPDYLSNVNVAGYHLHFFDDDISCGGHVFDFSFSGEVKVEICKASRLMMDSIDNDLFEDAKLIIADEESIKKVEKIRK